MMFAMVGVLAATPFAPSLTVILVGQILCGFVWGGE